MKHGLFLNPYLSEQLFRCVKYLAVAVDYNDAYNQERNDRLNLRMSEIYSRLSFIDSEILD